MNDDYLWDKSGERDEEIARLEALLARHRYVRAELSGAEASDAAGVALAHTTRPPRLAACASASAAAAVLCVWSLVARDRARASGYRVFGVDGRTLVAAGDAIATPSTSSARVEIADLGQVEIAPSSSLRIEDCGTSSHRLFLERGGVHARITGSPREFAIGTPAGLTVDLGCEYTLDVAPDGRARLAVSDGQVAFEFAGRAVYVPAGAVCWSTPGFGPGIPVFDDAHPEFRRALESIFRFGHCDEPELEVALFEGSREDTLSLWHLFDAPRTPPAIARRAYERLSQVFPKPPEATEAGLLAGDRAMRAAWMELMKPSWRVQ